MGFPVFIFRRISMFTRRCSRAAGFAVAGKKNTTEVKNDLMVLAAVAAESAHYTKDLLEASGLDCSML